MQQLGSGCRRRRSCRSHLRPRAGDEADTCLGRLRDHERAPGLAPGCLPEQAGRGELADQAERRLRMWWK